MATVFLIVGIALVLRTIFDCCMSIEERLIIIFIILAIMLLVL